jgi:FAD/FMN-containing dehydrogenase
MPMTVLDPGVHAQLVDIVGSSGVLTDPELTGRYTTDWTGRFVGSGPAVVRPHTIEQVAAILACCHDNEIALVPQGGNTGLVGGGIPLAGEVVLSLAMLDELDAVDLQARQVTAAGGVTLESVQRAASAHGLAYAVDLAARQTATIGGTVATNAGGLHLLRYGGTRDQLVGIEAVLADGRVISHLGGLPKDNTGYDLVRLLCGSEGTLAVVTRTRLRLMPRYDARVTALLAFDSCDDSLAASGELRYRLETVEAVELFFQSGLDLVCETFSLPRPFAERHGCYLLVECAAHSDPSDALAGAVGRLDGVADAAVATDVARRAALWRYREDHTTAINTLGAPHKLDVCLPLTRLSEFVAEVEPAIHSNASEARCWLFGHAGDGNLHVNVTGLAPDDERVDAAVLELVASMGGSISAEHGIGTAKKRWLHLVRSDTELDTMRAIKKALDPRGILNPNVLFP